MLSRLLKPFQTINIPATPVRIKLLEFAKNDTSSIANSSLFFDHEICDAAALFQVGIAHKSGYFNVGIVNVRAIARADFRSIGPATWAQLAERLYCTGWESDKIFQYFESDLLDNDFPAPGSGSPLKLESYGSVSYVSCGNHRIVAGMLYLAHKYGDRGVFRKCKGTYYPLAPYRLRLIQSLMAENPGALHMLHAMGQSRPHFLPKGGNMIMVQEQRRSDRSSSIWVTRITLRFSHTLFARGSRESATGTSSPRTGFIPNSSFPINDGNQ